MTEEQIEQAGGIRRLEAESVRAALHREARRAMAVGVLLMIGVVGLVATWSNGLWYAPVGGEGWVASAALLCATAWGGSRLAQWRYLERLAALAP